MTTSTQVYGLTQEQVDELTCPECGKIGFSCICEPSREDKLAAFYFALAIDNDTENGPQWIDPADFGLTYADLETGAQS